ncbi:hypothetical protein [Salipiger abyssi]|uniref:hypothetical protein n=1 Tax=Salipiger abyssi TaxID=1250539 RepID=UPI000977601B|nr:hypothetical protein [Salipiger abyssi]
MADRDDPKQKMLRDTTKPELRPSWGVSRDNAPKGAASINWGDRGVPAPSPGGTGAREKTGLFAGRGQTQPSSPAPKANPELAKPERLTGLFSDKARETRQTQADRALKGASEGKDAARGPQETPRATIQQEKQPVFRRHRGRGDEPDRGR